MRITHLKYNQINFKKYDLCIDASYNSHIYAYSWYLDIVTKRQWEVLVLDDYKAVMPLPFSRVKRKLFKKMITQPLLCQQLGVFYLTELTQETSNLFLNEYKKMSVFSYQFNYFNTLFLNDLSSKTEKVNYELDLHKPYNVIKSNFNKNLKRNLNKAQKNSLSITNNITITQFITLKKQHSKHKIKRSNFFLMEKLTAKLIQHKKAKFHGVLKDNKLIAIGFFIYSNNRIIHLLSVSNQEGKTEFAIPFLFDNIIQKNENENTIFDFEGSMLPGVAQFFKSFGAVNKPYIYHQC